MDRTRPILIRFLGHAHRRQRRNLLRRTCGTTSGVPTTPPAQTEPRSSVPLSQYRSPSPSPGNSAAVEHRVLAPPPDPWRSDFYITPGESNLIVGGQPFSFKCGHVARFADGAAICQIGHTAVLATAVSAKSDPGCALGFVPLTVDYRQKAAASGRLPGNRMRREMGQSDMEILSSRLIDRSIRPLFDKRMIFGETQLICNLLANDGANDAVVAAINAASCALALSDIPWNGPVAAVRVGIVDGEVVINPTRKVLKQSALNLVLTATKQKSVMMLEAEAKIVTITDIMHAVSTGIKATKSIIDSISNLAAKHGRRKRQFPERRVDEQLEKEVEKRTKDKFAAILSDATLDKFGRDRAYQAAAARATQNYWDELTEEDTWRKEIAFSPNVGANDAAENTPSADAEPSSLRRGLSLSTIRGAVERCWARQFRERILTKRSRCDGRYLEQLRLIRCETNVHEPLHGSALFQRGQTQVLCTMSFDSLAAALKDFDPIDGGKMEKHFMLDYSFPSYATNDIGKPGRNRRELGHGALAEKALRPVLPDAYPFTMRLTSEVLESNGSSSMATVCGGALALIDARVPLKEMAAGVAVGLVTKVDPETGDIIDHAVLTDILGIEDYLGDMDFKIAGTKAGITALQLDLKLETGLPLTVMQEALAAGHEAKSKILGIMAKYLNEQRGKVLKTNLPKTEIIEVPANKRQNLIGAGGFRLKKVEAETGASLTQLDEFKWQLFAPNASAFGEASLLIEELLRDEKSILENLEFGAIYPATIVEIVETGVMIKLEPGMTPVYVPSNQLHTRRVRHPSMLGLSAGQEIFLKYFGRDPTTGKLRLSRKVLEATTTTTRLTEFREEEGEEV